MFLLASNPKNIFINYGSSKISETVKEDMCNAQPLLCSAIAVEWFQTQQSNRTEQDWFMGRIGPGQE